MVPAETAPELAVGMQTATMELMEEIMPQFIEALMVVVTNDDARAAESRERISKPLMIFALKVMDVLCALHEIRWINIHGNRVRIFDLVNERERIFLQDVHRAESPPPSGD